MSESRITRILTPFSIDGLWSGIDENLCVEMLRIKSLSESGFAGFDDFQDYRCVFKTDAFHSFHSKTVNSICFSKGYKPLSRLGFRQFSSKVAMKLL